MKLIRWINTMLLMLVFTGTYLTAQADWVPVEGMLELAQEVHYVDGDLVEVTVTIMNISGFDIEGTLRMTFSPLEENLGFPIPVNALLAGEDGSDPTSYFDIPSNQENLFEGEDVIEVSTVTMDFSLESLQTFFGSDLNTDVIDNLPNYYSLQVELNDESLLSEIFRKKISKVPEFYSGEGGIQVMPVYVKA